MYDALYLNLMQQNLVIEILQMSHKKGVLYYKIVYNRSELTGKPKCLASKQKSDEYSKDDLTHPFPV